jgi:hypothetical protein
MNQFTEDLAALKKEVESLKVDALELLKRTSNLRGSPLIQGYSGMRLNLNASLDVIKLLRDIEAKAVEVSETSSDSSITAHEAEYDHDAFEAATAIAHSHVNLTLLETYAQTEANLADAVSKKHAHAAVATDHAHSKLVASDGCPDAVSVDADGNATVVKNLTTQGGRKIKKTRLTSADSPYTVMADDDLLITNVTTGNVQLNFPDGIDSTKYMVKVTGSTNACILQPHASDGMFEGAAGASDTLYPGEEEIIVFDTTENSWV